MIVVENRINKERLCEIATSVSNEMERLGVEYITIRLDISDEELQALYEYYGFTIERMQVGFVRFKRFREAVGVNK